MLSQKFIYWWSPWHRFPGKHVLSFFRGRQVQNAKASKCATTPRWCPGWGIFVKALLACGPASYLNEGLKRLVVAIRNLLSVLWWFHLSGNSACSAYPCVCLQRAMPWQWGLVSAGAKAWHPFARVNNWKNALRPSKNNRPATPIRSR